MINQQEWLRTRKNLLDEVKSQVQVRLGPPEPALRRYSIGLETEFKNGWRASSLKELHQALNKAKVVLGADFHAYSQSQRAHVRLLRDQIRRPVVLALECLLVEHEEAAESYLAGNISEDRFLDEIDWEKNWGFPWIHYRPLFELARERGFKVRGMNRRRVNGLKQRDEWSARRLFEIQQESSGALVYVLMGEWHLASQHLPQRLHAKWRLPGETIVLFQDSERLYFQLARKRRETRVEVLKASRDRYCLMVSPPWMKWQSYLMYLEHAYDRELQEDLTVDYSDHVAALIEVLEKDLGVHVSKAQVQVYSPGAKATLVRPSKSFPKAMERALIYHLEHDLSFYLPEKQWLYLSRPTINHAAGLAGLYLHGQLAGRTRTLWNQPHDWLPLVWVEALSFFFSKWINPQRKAESLDSIRLQLSVRRPRDSARQALLLALDHRLTEVVWLQTGRMRKSKGSGRGRLPRLEASRILGSMLGERLFQAVQSRRLRLSLLMSWLKVDVEADDFAEFYWKLIEQLETERR